MSQYPPPGGAPPPYGQPPYPAYPPHQGGYAYIPTPVMMPMPMYPHAPPAPAPHEPPTNTYVTNYIYQPPGQVHVVDNADASMIDWLPTNPTTARNLSARAVIGGYEGFDRSPLWIIRARYGGDCVPGKFAAKHNTAFIPYAGKEVTVYDFEVNASMIDWLPTNPTTARNLSARAVIGGYEGFDRSPLWIIRARYGGDCVPGKFAAKHNTAFIPYAGKEVTVYDFEVMVAAPHLVRWLSGSSGSVPPGAIPAGNTESGEPLYIGRARHLMNLHPGKVHGSHGCCYIPYGGNEISYRNYEVLCRV